MAYTQADLDQIDVAIASGAHIQSMTVGGQQFTFRTADDVLKLRAHVAGQLSGGKKNHRLAATSKGA